MAYDVAFPQDDGYLKDFPVGMREQVRALIQDELVNAGLLRGLKPGNVSGNLAVANGNECVNLNAAKLNGKTAADFAPKVHAHSLATASADGFMSGVMFTKLAGVATGAEVNQNAFANVKVGSVTVQADAKQDVLELIAGKNITLTPDATNDRITIGLNGKVASAAVADNATRATTAGTADNATKVAGLAVNTTGTNNGANQIMRTDGNGYTRVGWLNTTSGNMGTAGINRIYCSNDEFVRYKSVADFKTALGLNLVNNTLDANKSVNYANTSGVAARLGRGAATGTPMTFNWSGQGGQPSWLWGGNDGTNMYVYNPGNFSVNYAKSAGSVNWGNIIGVPAAALGGIVAAVGAPNGYMKFANGLIIQWGRTNASIRGLQTITFPLRFPTACYIAMGTTIRNGAGEQGHGYSWNINQNTFQTYTDGGSGTVWVAIGI